MSSPIMESLGLHSSATNSARLDDLKKHILVMDAKLSTIEVAVGKIWDILKSRPTAP